jgi:hypothetical protein
MLRPFAFAIPVTFGLLIAACSAGSTNVVGPTGVPVGATDQTCRAIDDCPNVVCSCERGVVNARRCVDGYCINTEATCRETCAAPPDNRPDGQRDADPTSPTASSPDDACIAVSISDFVPRVAALRKRIADHQLVPATPANGKVDVSRTSGNLISSVRYDAAGSDADYTDSYSYDSENRLTYWRRDAGGTAADITESYNYDSNGRVTYLRVDAEGSKQDVSESLTYDAQDHLTYWRRDADGSALDVVESYSYDSQGLLTYWRRDADGTALDVVESFSYDTQGRLTYWRKDADGSNKDVTVSVSYSQSGSSVSTTGPAAGVTVTQCR